MAMSVFVELACADLEYDDWTSHYMWCKTRVFALLHYNLSAPSVAIKLVATAVGLYTSSLNILSTSSLCFFQITRKGSSCLWHKQVILRSSPKQIVGYFVKLLDSTFVSRGSFNEFRFDQKNPYEFRSTMKNSFGQNSSQIYRANIMNKISSVQFLRW